MHNRQWSPRSDYIINLPQFEWYSSRLASVMVDPPAFFDWFFRQQEGWGLSMYEQDWMCTEYDQVIQDPDSTPATIDCGLAHAHTHACTYTRMRGKGMHVRHSHERGRTNELGAPPPSPASPNVLLIPPHMHESTTCIYIDQPIYPTSPPANHKGNTTTPQRTKQPQPIDQVIAISTNISLADLWLEGMNRCELGEGLGEGEGVCYPDQHLAG